MGLVRLLASLFDRSSGRHAPRSGAGAGHARRPGDPRPRRVDPLLSGPPTEPALPRGEPFDPRRRGELHIEATPAAGLDLRPADPRIARARERERQVAAAAEPEGRHARYEDPAQRSTPRRGGRFADPELQKAYDSVFGGDGYGGMPTSYPEPPAENSPPQ